MVTNQEGSYDWKLNLGQTLLANPVKALQQAKRIWRILVPAQPTSGEKPKTQTNSLPLTLTLALALSLSFSPALSLSLSLSVSLAPSLSPSLPLSLSLSLSLSLPPRPQEASGGWPTKGASGRKAAAIWPVKVYGLGP